MLLLSVERGFRWQWQRMEIISCWHEHRRAGMALINSFVVVYIKSVVCNVCISDLKFSIIFLTMPSESEVNLAKSFNRNQRGAKSRIFNFEQRIDQGTKRGQ